MLEYEKIFRVGDESGNLDAGISNVSQYTASSKSPSFTIERTREREESRLVIGQLFADLSIRMRSLQIRSSAFEHGVLSRRGQKSSGDLARDDASRTGIFGQNGTGRRWMGSSMVGVALWVGVAGSIQGGFVRRRRHHGMNEYPVYPSTPLSEDNGVARLLLAN